MEQKAEISDEKRTRQPVAEVGPYLIRRSDGFESPWEAGTTEGDVKAVIQGAIRRALR